MAAKSAAKAIPNFADPNLQARDVLREVFKTCRGAFITAGIFSFAVNMFILTVPLYMFSMFDRVLASQNLMTLAMLFLMANAALIIQALIDIARSYVFINVSGWIDRQLSGRLLSASITNALTRGNARSADSLSKLNQLRNFLSGQTIYTMMDAPWIPIFLVVLFALNFWIGVVSMVGAVILVILALLNEYVSKPALSRANQSMGRATTNINAAVRNASVVESMGMTPHVIRRWHKQNDQTLELQAVASGRAAVIAAWSKYARMAIQMSIMSVSALEMLAPGSTLSGGGMMAAVILVGRALMPLEAMISNWRSLAVARDQYRDIANTLQKAADRPRSTVIPPSPKGILAVENVSFHPRGAERPILARVNFTLEPGTVLGIVGPSAAGKSTLASLIVGISKPTGGTIRLDGADVFAWPSEDLGRYIGYLPQEVELFGGPIRDNISRLNPDATSEQIIAAADLAGLHDLIQHMPKGYDTEVGDQGMLLSGGQRQRVGLARALFGNPLLLVLDEPNASLDSQGEDALISAIQASKERGAAVILIAHRPSILKATDKIMILQNGMIQRVAPRDDLLPLLTGSTPRAVPPPNVKSIGKQAGG
jgi:PrtD family type I secretion system ABC transporter